MRDISFVLEQVRAEVENSCRLFPSMNSAHEAYSVLLEEVDEFWEHVKTNAKRRDIAAMRKELIQVAAMAIRAIHDVIDKDGGVA